MLKMINKTESRLRTAEDGALFGTGGIDFYLKNYSVEFTSQYPLSRNLNGIQPQNVYRFFIGTGYSF